MMGTSLNGDLIIPGRFGYQRIDYFFPLRIALAAVGY